MTINRTSAVFESVVCFVCDTSAVESFVSLMFPEKTFKAIKKNIFYVFSNTKVNMVFKNPMIRVVGFQE